MRAFLVKAVGIDDRDGPGQLRLALVVIDDDHVEPGVGGGLQGLMGGGTAVHADHHRRPLSQQVFEGLGTGAVALAPAVWDVNEQQRPDGAQKTR